MNDKIRFIAMLFLFFSSYSTGETLLFKLIIRDHLFYPSELIVPSGIKFKLEIDNQDVTPEEFESYELNREKIILANQKAIIFIGPLNAGEYPFFGEFNMSTAKGKIIATDNRE